MSSMNKISPMQNNRTYNYASPVNFNMGDGVIGSYDNIKLKISDQSIELGDLDIHVIDEPRINLLPDLLIDDIEILE